jgi:hypothetical protein
VRSKRRFQKSGERVGTLAGVFLKNRGDLENAKKYLIRAAQSDDWENSNHVLACQLLREMKVKIPAEDGAAQRCQPRFRQISIGAATVTIAAPKVPRSVTTRLSRWMTSA